MHTVTLFNYPDVLKTYQDKFRYLLVDEYQTQLVQYLFLRLLARPAISAVWVMMTSPFMAGAGPKWVISSSSRKISKAPR